MIRRRTYCLALVLLLYGLTGSTAGAQQKIGYVDTDYILSQMSEYQGVQQKLETISKQWKDRLDKMKEDITKLKKDYKSKKILYSDQQKEQKKKKIQKKVSRRKDFRDRKFGADGDYFKKQKQLLEPLQRKVFNAINTVAKRNNFDFVFDQAQNSNMLYSLNKWNLNKKILQELGITLNQSSN